MDFSAPYILLDDQISPHVRLYTNPVDLIIIDEPKDIKKGFARLQKHHKAGRHLAGYFSYELGYALEKTLAKLIPEKRRVPLIVFAAFDGFSQETGGALIAPNNLPEIALKPQWSEAHYTRQFKAVKTYIEAGDCYQINLTFPMSGTTDLDALTLYASLRAQQPGQYGGIVALDGPGIISLSPELFFQKSGDLVTMRPMKGTLKRHGRREEDKAAAAALQKDEKSMAENLMIVDLLRNDLSRISEPGSVEVPELYSLETYPTLHQMTSKVQAKLNPGTTFETLIRNLFPSGSVTGAPKIRAMEIIRQLERSPRGAYCGSMGYLDPNGDACFNVGIRTLTLNKKKLTYNVGSGVVLDSTAKDEYAECLLKAKVLERPEPVLIETLRWSPRRSFIRRDLHIARLERSATALGYKFNRAEVIDWLKYAVRIKSSRQRVRLTLAKNGQINTEATDYLAPDHPWRFSLSKNPLTPNVQSTAHKTSLRGFYDGERARARALTGCDEVLLFNDKGQLCEGSFTSVFVEKNGKMLTPALSCGLLPGVYREEMINSGKASEAILTIDDLAMADFTFVGNSLRGLIQADIIAFDRV